MEESSETKRGKNFQSMVQPRKAKFQIQISDSGKCTKSAKMKNERNKNKSMAQLKRNLENIRTLH
jgi:hypothetical protein